MSEEKINTLQINMAKVEEKLDAAKETSDRIETKLDNHISKEDEQLEKYRKMFEWFFEKADKKYASKRVETVFWAWLWTTWTVLLIWAINILLSHWGVTK